VSFVSRGLCMYHFMCFHPRAVLTACSNTLQDGKEVVQVPLFCVTGVPWFLHVLSRAFPFMCCAVLCCAVLCCAVLLLCSHTLLGRQGGGAGASLLCQLCIVVCICVALLFSSVDCADRTLSHPAGRQEGCAGALLMCHVCLMFLCRC
jgi:hypothetical protein